MASWTEEGRIKAIEMIKNGFRDKEIASVVGMSDASISLLRYREVFNYSEKIECKLCGNKYRQITQRHLRIKHGINLDDYKKAFPDSDLMTKNRQEKYLSFAHPNKGKTYDEIYGNKEAHIKRDKISSKQIGRPSPKLAGTGITGTRRDTNTYARSTYEANVDRIFIFEGKKYIDELSSKNKRFNMVDGNGVSCSYQPDRIDVDGLFKKGAYLEIKGYMYPEDWAKIQLFRKQFVNEQLIVICPDENYCDVNYKDLKDKYQKNIPLWEGEKQNYKTRPDLYKLDIRPQSTLCI